MEAVYLGSFDSSKDIEAQFGITLSDAINIIVATYETRAYEGYAFVLFEQGGKLYEVNASHCSCYGLEGQWDPELATVEDLRFRLDRGVNFYGAGPTVREFIEQYKAPVAQLVE